MAMTLVRLISPSLRSAALMAAGCGLLVAPFALGLEASAIVTGTGLGILMVALAVAGTDTSGRGTLPVSAQAAYDRGLALGLLLVAAIFGLAGQIGALAVFAAVGSASLIVTAVTRYSARAT
jgi:hypothetical protein